MRTPWSRKKTLWKNYVKIEIFKWVFIVMGKKIETKNEKTMPKHNKRAEEWRQAIAEAIEHTRKDTTITYSERQKIIEDYRRAMDTTWI